jgi:hypothetical protein
MIFGLFLSASWEEHPALVAMAFKVRCAWDEVRGSAATAPGDTSAIPDKARD